VYDHCVYTCSRHCRADSEAERNGTEQRRYNPKNEIAIEAPLGCLSPLSLSRARARARESLAESRGPFLSFFSSSELRGGGEERSRILADSDSMRTFIVALVCSSRLPCAR